MTLIACFRTTHRTAHRRNRQAIRQELIGGDQIDVPLIPRRSLCVFVRPFRDRPADDSSNGIIMDIQLHRGQQHDRRPGNCPLSTLAQISPAMFSVRPDHPLCTCLRLRIIIEATGERTTRLHWEKRRRVQKRCRHLTEELSSNPSEAALDVKSFNLPPTVPLTA